jgi:hypothetical protein
MLKEVHDHIVGELHQGARTDTVIVLTAVVFNLVVLGINWGVASRRPYSGDHRPEDWILLLMSAILFVINAFSVRALATGRDIRERLIKGLMSMYEDEGVNKYYDSRLLENYRVRYKMFIFIIVSLACISIAVPLIERFTG